MTLPQKPLNLAGWFVVVDVQVGLEWPSLRRLSQTTASFLCIAAQAVMANISAGAEAKSKVGDGLLHLVRIRKAAARR